MNQAHISKLPVSQKSAISKLQVPTLAIQSNSKIQIPFESVTIASTKNPSIQVLSVTVASTIIQVPSPMVHFRIGTISESNSITFASTIVPSPKSSTINNISNPKSSRSSLHRLSKSQVPCRFPFHLSQRSPVPRSKYERNRIAHSRCQ